MSYRIGRVSRIVGLTTQTLREYEKLGLLDARKDEASGYRYFDPQMICKFVALRYLRNFGLTLEETKELLGETAVPYEHYRESFERVLTRQKAALEYQQMIYDRVKEQVEITSTLYESIGVCSLKQDLKFYCLDYLRGEEQLLFEEEELKTLNSWIERALFTCNYSPIPQDAFIRKTVQPVVMGLIIREEYAHRLNLHLNPPVFVRYAPLWLCARIPHSIIALPSHEDLACMTKYMEEHRLTFDGEAFLIGDCDVWEEGQHRAYSIVYIPVRHISE